MTLTINNETFASNSISSVMIDINSHSITIKDMIEMKIRKEVEEYNNKLENFSTNVEITEFEKRLNSNKRIKNKKAVDVEKQIEIGIKAFNNKEYFVIVDDKQVEDINKIIEVKETTSISFLRLTPLIGG